MKLAALASVLLLAISCGEDEHQRPPECDEIGEACHPFDTGSGPAHDCHANSHDTWTAAECIANRAMCLMVCSNADAGVADAM
jgi:hypothetical protein